MEVTTKELRIMPGKLLEQIHLGQEITVTYRGKRFAKIVPIDSFVKDEPGSSIFSMWQDLCPGQTVDEQVRDIRKGRQF